MSSLLGHVSSIQAMNFARAAGLAASAAVQASGLTAGESGGVIIGEYSENIDGVGIDQGASLELDGGTDDHTYQINPLSTEGAPSLQVRRGEETLMLIMPNT